MHILTRLWQAPARFRRVTTSRDYIPQIDGLRLLALLPVMVWHASARGIRFYEDGHSLTAAERAAYGWLPDGHIGVVLFFFISGYVIAYPFLAGRAPAVGAFYRRRLYRLEPPYILMLLVCLALIKIGGAPANAPTFQKTGIPLGQSFAASLFYLHGLIFHFNPRLLPPAWSLEIEFQFYLLSPALLWAYMRFHRFGSRITVAGLAIAISIIGTSLLEAYFGAHGIQRWLVTGYFHAFATGIVACDFALRARPAQAAPGLRFDVGLLIGLAMLAVLGTYTEWPLSAGERIVRDALSVPAVVLVYMGAMRGPLGRRILASGWAALLGGMCYSIYLVHVPLMHIVATLLYRVVRPDSLIGSLAIAWGVLIPLAITGGFAFYLAIERPCMSVDWPRQLLRKLAAPAGSLRRLRIKAENI